MLSRGLTKKKVKDGQASMLYKIDSGKNQSKYYEMLIVRKERGIGYTLIKRYGRLGDRFREITEDFKNLAGAQFELQKVEQSKIKKGYISAYGDYHRAPDGKKLPMGQYPVGLDTNPGSWSNQQVNSCKPVLIKLKSAINDAIADSSETRVNTRILKDLKTAYTLTDSLTESMAQKVKEKIRKLIARIEGTNGRWKRDPLTIKKELISLQKYLSLQLSLVS
jgi:predicted DNA-binding WGR domain protein